MNCIYFRCETPQKFKSRRRSEKKADTIEQDIKRGTVIDPTRTISCTRVGDVCVGNWLNKPNGVR